MRESAAEFVFAAEPTHARQRMSVFHFKVLESPHTPFNTWRRFFAAWRPSLDSICT